jgi:hypothetical protein
MVWAIVVAALWLTPITAQRSGEFKLKKKNNKRTGVIQ